MLFGGTALAGLLLVGALIDRWLRQLVTASMVLFLSACVLLAVLPESATAACLAVGVWGLAFGGAATLFVTSLANAAGPGQDVAQSMMTTVWNLAIFAGGTLLQQFGPHSFSFAATAILLAALLIVWNTRRRHYWTNASAS